MKGSITGPGSCYHEEGKRFKLNRWHKRSPPLSCHVISFPREYVRSFPPQWRDSGGVQEITIVGSTGSPGIKYVFPWRKEAWALGTSEILTWPCWRNRCGACWCSRILYWHVSSKADIIVTQTLCEWVRPRLHRMDGEA